MIAVAVALVAAPALTDEYRGTNLRKTAECREQHPDYFERRLYCNMLAARVRATAEGKSEVYWAGGPPAASRTHLYYTRERRRRLAEVSNPHINIGNRFRRMCR